MSGDIIGSQDSVDTGYLPRGNDGILIYRNDLGVGERATQALPN
jgi:hypothetical protein